MIFQGDVNAAENNGTEQTVIINKQTAAGERLRRADGRKMVCGWYKLGKGLRWVSAWQKERVEL